MKPESDITPSRRPGFSMIELLVVVAILILLTTMYWGSSKGSREHKRQEACTQNLQRLYISLEIYANESGNKFPIVPGARTSEEPLDRLVPKYTVDTSLFTCPGTKQALLPSGESLVKGKISYAYFMGRSSTDSPAPLMCDRMVDTLSKAAGQNAFSTTGAPPANNYGKYGGNFLFGDGHAEAVAARLPFAIPLPPPIVLLNPKP